ATAAGGRTDGGSSGSGGTAGRAAGGGTMSPGSGGAGGAGGTPVKPSAGCSASSAPTAGRTMIDVSGTKREYILTLPASYDAHHPYPLIVAFHGGQYNDDWLVNGEKPQSGPYYGILSEAKDSAIFVASQALTGSWTNDNNRDIDYVLAMVTLFKSQLCIDENRIFATGFSMGGIMTNTVACTQPTLFRAVAAMSGKFPTTPATCTPSHTIAYWASHGMSDTTIDIKLGQMVRDKFASTNHCTGPGSTPDANGCTTYQGCDAGYPVVWCPFAGIHEPAPFAGAAVWKFLSQF
ncbi:MAG TPA: prolyl oligopeptidase family serine peptidase, partial [Polyangia bacterium]